MRGVILAVVATFLAAPMARAQVSRTFPSSTSSDSDWSATAARTVGAGHDVVTAEAGWPDIAAEYLHGLDARTDVGARVAFDYGFMNTTIGLAGVDLQVVGRRFLMTSGQFDIEAHARPGLTFYGNNGEALFGLSAPVGVLAAYRVDPRLTVDAGVDVPILLSFTNPFGVIVGPLVGGGVEYRLERNLSLTAKVRVGPEVSLESTKTDTQGNQIGGVTGRFGFQTLVGVAYGLR
jgi:hypothetical protein